MQMVAAPHRLDTLADTPQPPIPVAPVSPHDRGNELTQIAHRNLRNVYPRPLATHDIYEDNFISLAQGNHCRLRTICRILLHTMEQVFRPLDASDSPFCQEPVSVKKLKKT
jgi:hypothetical protein